MSLLKVFYREKLHVKLKWFLQGQMPRVLLSSAVTFIHLFTGCHVEWGLMMRCHRADTDGTKPIVTEGVGEELCWLPGVYNKLSGLWDCQNRSLRRQKMELWQQSRIKEGSGRRNPLEKIQDKIGNRTNVSWGMAYVSERSFQYHTLKTDSKSL